jgi:ABC-type spermidine/putrescine transport system permease subunit II
MWISAGLRSVVIGILTGFLSVALGVAAAFGFVRENFKGKGLVVGVALAPAILPKVIVGVSLMYLFSYLRLIDTTMGIVIGHVVIAIPYVVLTMTSVLQNYDRTLDHAAWVLGAGRWQTLRRVTLPVLMPAILTAFVFSFITSFDDVTLALFLSGSEVITLPKVMWLEAFLNVTPALAAVSSIVMVLTIMIVVVLDRVQSRKI